MTENKDNLKEVKKTSKRKSVKKAEVKSIIEGIVDVEVIAESFGTYKKGDVFKMHSSTALACSKVVKIK